MKLQPIQIVNHNNRFTQDYRELKTETEKYFHYKPFTNFEQRLQELKGRTFQREALVQTLTEMNLSWGASEQTINQIKRLSSPESVAVIGGQQAGLLTGPLYSVNKLISVIKLAREQEKYLQVPVIPVFWIAGEDHDYDEINHTFTANHNKIKKHTLYDSAQEKKSVSQMDIDQTEAKQWLDQFLNELKETSYTKEWYNQTLKHLQDSGSFVDFFAKLLLELFPNEGIVLIDSNHASIRGLEREYFEILIDQQAAITNEVYQTTQELQQSGYHVMVDVDREDANLFYEGEHGERILLKRDGDDWVGKNDEVRLTTASLREIARRHPGKLSNNVITRPIMQELLLPTLAFVGGDAEINYWGTLKRAFELLGLKVPPIVPRLSFTYITPRIQKLLETRVMDVEEVVKKGTNHLKQQWLVHQAQAPLDVMFEEAKEGIEAIHQPLRQYVETLSVNLGREARKNIDYIQQQMDYLQTRTEKTLQDQYQLAIDQFDEVGMMLHPKGGLQERVWSPYILINEFGVDFMRELVDDSSITFTESHYLVYL